jgi:MFS family permease
LLSINTVNWFYAFAIIIPVVIIPLYAKSLGASLFQASIMVGIFYGVNAVFGVIMGSLSDILGRRKPFLISSSIGTVVVFLLIAFTEIPLLLILSMGLFGVITAAFLPCMMGMISEISSKAEKGKNMGLLNTSTSLGWAGGSFLGGFVAGQFNFQITFISGCIIAIIATVLTISILRETRTNVASDSNKDFRKILTALKNRFLPSSGESSYLKENGLSWFYFIIFLRYTAYLGSFALLPIFFASIASTFWAGMLVAIYMGVSGILMSPIGKFSDKYGRKPIVIFGLVGTSIALVFYAISYSLIVLILTQFFYSFVFAAIFTGGSAFVSDVSPEMKHNEAMGFLNSSITFGAVIGSIIAGIIAEMFGIRIMFLILAIPPVFGALVVLLRIPETVSLQQQRI